MATDPMKDGIERGLSMRTLTIKVSMLFDPDRIDEYDHATQARHGLATAPA